MVLLAKRLCVCAVMISCLLQAAQAEKWRFIPKQFRRCDVPQLAIDFRNLKITHTDRGETFYLEAEVEVNKNVTSSRVDVNVYNTDANLKVLTWTFTQICEIIAKGHKYIDPMFTDRAMPRTCHFVKGVYPVHSEYDVHGDFIGASLRGNYLVDARAYTADNELIFCFNGIGYVKKDTFKTSKKTDILSRV